MLKERKYQKRQMTKEKNKYCKFRKNYNFYFKNRFKINKKIHKISKNLVKNLQNLDKYQIRDGRTKESFESNFLHFYIMRIILKLF